ncbi:citrate transporter [Agarivorans sp. OAG1]|uniref:SLC13 family permease n=1 Tax=Agarivorans sp. OAG1 TaxID=3082387 RepID=UPI002B2CFFDD|nr:citrate transporter [Agarivorans sp. OAG1]
MDSNFSVKRAALLLAFAAALWIMLFPFAGYTDKFSYSAAVVIVTLALWSTGALPPFLAGLLFFALTTTFKLLPPDILFSGFGSTAVWLVVSGFVIGAAITSSGLGNKLALSIAPHIMSSYTLLIAGLVFSAALLGFVMPSSVGRAVVLIPIGMALAEHVGFAQGSNGRRGIATALALACNMPSFAILPSNIPNMILAGSSETLFDIGFNYTDYLLLHFPILGLVKSLLIVALVLRIFPASISTSPSLDLLKSEHNFDSKQQIRVAVLLGITLLFWITDSVHGINPAWVGLCTAVILLTPRWGVVSPKLFNSSVDFGTLVFIAAALGLGALVNHSGLGEHLGQSFSYLLPASSESSFLHFMALSLIATFTGLVTTVPGVPTVLAPMAANFAEVSGFSISAVLMTQVIGFSTVIFPYQAAPLIVAMQLANEGLSALVKVTVPLTIITLLILVPLDYLWWLALGWIA